MKQVERLLQMCDGINIDEDIAESLATSAMQLITVAPAAYLQPLAFYLDEKLRWLCYGDFRYLARLAPKAVILGEVMNRVRVPCRV